MPNSATEWWMASAVLAPPSASRPTWPSMMVSTVPIAIQPSSASTTGPASASIGGSSSRRLASFVSKDNRYQPAGLPWFCWSSHFCSGAK